MKRSNTTRYLCAAAQLDRTFRTQVLDDVLDEEYRVVSIPEDVDLSAVIKNCISAKNRKTIRDAGVFFFFVVGFTSAYRYEITYNYPTSALFISIFSSFFSIWFLAAWAVVIFETWTTRYKVIARFLLKHNFNPEGIPLTPGLTAHQKLSGFTNQEESNVVIYSGFSPFIGSGLDIGGWSFTLDIDKGKEIMTVVQKPDSFTVQELYSLISSDIEKLDLTGTIIQDKLFVNGQEIRADQRFLPALFRRPVTTVDTSILEEFIGSQSDDIRHYKCIRIVGWQGDIILSIFLRFVKLRRNLFVEASYFFLPPLKQEYRKIDNISPNPTWRQLLKMVLETFLKSVILYPGSAFLLGKDFLNPLIRWNKRRANRRLIRENPLFDYGAITNIRELAASDSFTHYFQKLDREMYLKLVERQVLDSITNFLDAHNIDTSDLQARQDTILNNGVIVTGGSVEAQNLTVGERAKSIMNNVTQAVTSTKGPKPSK